MTYVTTTAISPDTVEDRVRAQRAVRGFLADIGPGAALALESCIHRGSCAEACQFYIGTGDPRYTPIRKIAPFKQAYRREMGPFAYKALSPTPRVTADDLRHWQDPLYDSCNMCGRYTLICPMGIDIADLVERARHGMFAAGLAPPDYLGAIAEKEHATGSPHGLTPPTVPDDDPRHRRDPWRRHACGRSACRLRADRLVDRRQDLSDLDGCAGQDLEPHGRELDLPHRRVRRRQRLPDGRRPHRTTQDHALHRFEAAIACGAKTVVMPECGHSYTEMRWEAANTYGAELPFEIAQIAELMARGLTDGRIRVEKVMAESATYHDACQLSRRGGATAAPRVILRHLGLDLHEMEDAGDTNFCCGGGDGVALIKRAQPLRDQTFAIKRRQIEATGVETVVTSCSGCRQTLEQGGKAVGWTKTVASPLELVADNLEERT